MGNIFLTGILIAGFVVGIRLMQSPRTALWGNRLGALSLALAVLLTLAELDSLSSFSVWLLMGAGGVTGWWLGHRVKMIHMPQTVAVLNGLGGGASALVAGSAGLLWGGGLNPVLVRFTVSFALAVGALTLSGSVVAALKLQGWITSEPIRLASHSLVSRALLGIGVLLILISPVFLHGSLFIFLVLVFSMYGIQAAVRIGGADMPVIISLLNSLSGVAAALSGLAVGNAVLVAVGALVGVAGLILTQIMCRAMNRRFTAVIAGFPAGKEPDSPSSVQTGHAQQQAENRPASCPETLEPSQLLKEARKILIVPGYGMAVAQAQGQVKELADCLGSMGKDVNFAIHPVAGRMPGHMNVLLAEAGIDYQKLLDMETANPLFPETDVVIVIGACDVINPAAASSEDTPISGMPILEVASAKHIIVCNLDEKPGYSGVENSLYQMEHVCVLWGNAAETVPSLKEDVLSSTRDGE